MSDFLDEVRDDCEAAEEDLDRPTMVWEGGTYYVAPTLLRRGTTLVIGGREVEIKMTLRVRWSGTSSTGQAWEFTGEEMPESQDRVTYGGREYKIAQVNDAHQAFLELDLMDVNR